MNSLDPRKENTPDREGPGAEFDEQKAQESQMPTGIIAENAPEQKVKTCASEYASRGFEVFPSPLDGKQSHKSEKHSGAKWGKTSDPDQVRRDWDKWPTANVGIALGAGSGFWAIDLDVKPGGLAAWDALVAEHPPLPRTVTVNTPSGGRHYWWRWPADAEIRNSVGKIGPGIDVRGEAGIVVAPPSVKPGKGAYAFAPGLSPDEVEIAPAPGWLVELAMKASAKKPAAVSVAVEKRDGPLRRMALRRKAESTFEQQLAELAEAPEGTRNDALNRIAYTVGGLARFLPDGAARDGLSAAVSGWDDPAKNEATIDRVLADGAAQPLDLELSLDDLLLSHEDVARAMVGAGWAQDHRWVPQWGDWLGWADGVWRARSDGEAVRDFRKFLSQSAGEVAQVAGEEISRIVAAQRAGSNSQNKTTGQVARAEAKMRKELGSVAFDKALESKMRSEAEASAGSFDAGPCLLGTPEGVVDLRTGKLRAGRREDMISRSVAVAPADEGARSVEWERFLDEAFPDDPPMWDFLQRLAGYCLTGLTREERFFFFYGSGRNGKGTFLETLYALMGEYACTAPSGLFLSNSNLNAENFLAGIDGARMIWASEIDRGRSWNEALLKEITGGDTITAKRLYRDPFSFKPQATLIIAGNTQPNFRGVDQAMRSRVALVPFEQCFDGKEDRGLKARLRGAEAPAIMRWAVDGAQKYLRDGLPLPQTVERASREYMDEEDTVLGFIAEECEKDAEDWTPTSLLHERFSAWMVRQGVKPWGQRTLTKELKTKGFHTSKRDTQGVHGLRLKGQLQRMEQPI
jgi:putative DNA primase/helicase